MAYTIYDRAGMPAITSTESGVTDPDTAVVKPPIPLGTVVRGYDPTYGEGEFIYLLGVGSTVVGSVVTYNTTTFQTALATVANTKNKGTSLAVAMSANVASKYGFYQISGNAVIKKTGVAVTPSVPVFISATSGRIKVLASAGQQVLGAQTANLTTIVTTTSTVVVTISRPFAQGQIT
jgi:hypothetical protein